ncbi:MAG: hypothetical protein WCG28_01115 [bacterium]
MKPYKRISKSALGLLVAGAMVTGGITMSYTNTASAQTISSENPNSSTTRQYKQTKQSSGVAKISSVAD